MRHILFCGIILACVGVIITFCMMHNGVDEMLRQYQRIASYSSEEMTYHSVTRPLFSDGVVFYHPKFPKLPIEFKTDKLEMKASPEEISLRFIGVYADFAQILKKRDGIDVISSFRQFEAPNDFLLKPIEGLVLLNQDTFNGNIHLRLWPHGKNISFQMTALVKGKTVLKVVGKIMAKGFHDGRLFHFADGEIQSMTMWVSDTSLLMAIRDYFQAIQINEPSSLQEAIDNKTDWKMNIELQEALPVKALIEKRITVKQ